MRRMVILLLEPLKEEYEFLHNLLILFQLVMVRKLGGLIYWQIQSLMRVLETLKWKQEVLFL